jgi:hypothetical protein
VQGHSHIQRTDRQIAFHPVADGAANDTAGIQVEYDREIQPTFPCPDVGDITSPLLVRGIRREILIQQIRRDIEGVIAVRRDFRFTSSDNLDPVLTHQTADSAMPDWLAQVPQLFRHARAPITLQAEPMLLTDMSQKTISSRWVWLIGRVR